MGPADPGTPRRTSALPVPRWIASTRRLSRRDRKGHTLDVGGVSRLRPSEVGGGDSRGKRSRCLPSL